MPNQCLAIQHSDQMVCDRCDLVWDMNDEYSPRCKGQLQGRFYLKKRFLRKSIVVLQVRKSRLKKEADTNPPRHFTDDYWTVATLDDMLSNNIEMISRRIFV